MTHRGWYAVKQNSNSIGSLEMLHAQKYAKYKTLFLLESLGCQYPGK